MNKKYLYRRHSKSLLWLLFVLLVACSNANDMVIVTPSSQSMTSVVYTTLVPTVALIESPTVTAFVQPTTMQPTALPTITFAPTPTTTPETVSTQVPASDIHNIIYVAGGVFQMGGSAITLFEECKLFRQGCQSAWFASSEPLHTVLLRPFSIDQFEVTNQAFITFLNTLKMQELACDGHDCINLADSRIEWDDIKGEYHAANSILNYPVTGVNWYGAASFCVWQGARLPTEAEWEMAASWNPDTKVKTLYPWGDVFIAEAVNFCDVKCQETQADAETNDGFILEAPVGSYMEGHSSIGVYDMAGNVWEWVNDWYAADYYQYSPTVNPTGPDTGDERVVRGGSWFDTGNFTSSVVRFPVPPEESSNTIGFRCVWDD